jgi:thiol-disulfide isomerase/thioredoxin
MNQIALGGIGFAILLLLGAPDAFASGADADYAAWKAVYEQSPRSAVPRGDKEAQDRFWRTKAEDLSARAEDFVAKNPADPRRWELMLRAVQMARWRDDAARTAFRERDHQWLAQMLASPDAPPPIREQAHVMQLLTELEEAKSAIDHGQRVSGPRLASKVDEYADQYPDSRQRSRVESALFQVLAQADRAEARGRAERLAAMDGPLADVGKDWARKLSFIGQPLEMKFTAADGHEVDLAAYRGRVVLVDFWATWCGPCMAEMPIVKAVYAKYRDQGFEVIGVSLDGGGITKGIQSGVKTREDFLAFLEREQMPWPQHYTNEGWKNEFAQRFGIKSIPAIFLIGKDGNVLSTDARGESLEPQVRQALGL